MKNRLTYLKNKKCLTIPSTIIIAFLVVSICSDISYAWQVDPRIPAANDPLAAELSPAIGRIVNSSNDLVCTAWIAQGGVLITAGHCQVNGKILEFNVPESEPCGFLNSADEKDRYVIDNIVASNSDGSSNDWKIFEVEDNPITGYQPIEAQLKYINFVKKDVDKASVPTIRLIDYGSDDNPSGPSCLPNSGNSENGTLQTYAGANETTGATATKLEINLYPESGASGGPIIDDNTGEAIGIFESVDNYGQGTSLHRNGLWSAFQNTQSTFTLTVTQKDDSGILTGSTISRWDVDNSDFDDYTLTGSSINFGTALEGNAEVFRGDQNIYNNPKEKFNEWVGFNSIRNHQVFQLQDQVYTSQFQKTHSGISVTNAFPEAPSLSGSGEIQFKDPWLIDYNDPDFDNSPRNRGRDAVFYSHSAPFNPGFNTINGKSYNGLFLNENLTFDEELPNYSVHTEAQTINFGGSLGQRKAVPIGWEGDGANFQNPDEQETPVVFTNSSAEARSKMKISRVTNTVGTNGSPGQRKIVRTANGWLHRTYESLGRVWYEAKPPGGDWEFIYKWSSIYVDDNGGSAPSIAAASDASTPAYPNSVILAWQQGTDITMRIYYYISSMGTYSNWYDYTLLDAVSSPSLQAQPNVVFSGQNQFIVLWETATGISFTLLKMDSSGFVEIASDSIPGTDGNSGQVAASSDINYYFPYFDIVWSQSGSNGASSIQFQQISESSGSVVYSKSSPVTISSSYMFLNANPSVITVNNEAVFSWMCRGTSSWDPMSQSACLRSYDYVNLGPFTQYDVSVSDASLARVGSNDYYVAWSQYFYYPESQYNNDLNRYAKSTSLSNKQTLNTDFRDIQLYDAPVGQDMRLSVFQHAGLPKYFDLSRPLDTSPLKAVSDTARQSARGLIVSAADKDGIYLEIGGFEVDGRSVLFTQVPGLPTSDSRSIEQLRQLPSAPKLYRLGDI